MMKTERKIFKSAFQKVMCLGSVISLVGWIAFAALEKLLQREIFTPFAVTFMTVFYHLAVRLVLGEWVLMKLIPKRPDYNRKYFNSRKPFEEKLYKFLKLKKAVSRVPTYSPDEFSRAKKSWEDIAVSTVRSEIVHTVNVFISFVPLLFSLKFGSFAVFLLTSLGAAAFDIYFVMIQRFNRPRILKIAEKEKERRAST